MGKAKNSPSEGKIQFKNTEEREQEIKRLTRKLREAQNDASDYRKDFLFEQEQRFELKDRYDELAERMEELRNSSEAITGHFTHKEALQCVCDTTKPLTVSDGTREGLKMLVLLHEVRETYMSLAEKGVSTAEAASTFDRCFNPLFELVKDTITDSITLRLLKSHGIEGI